MSRVREIIIQEALYVVINYPHMTLDEIDGSHGRTVARLVGRLRQLPAFERLRPNYEITGREYDRMIYRPHSKTVQQVLP